MTEHGTKGRKVGSSLKLWMTLGYTTKEVIRDENIQYFVEENCLLYSQKIELLKLPIKAKNWDVKVKVENLLNCMYNDENSSLYYGLLKPHKIAFTLAILLFIKSCAENRDENKAFHKALHSDIDLLNEAEVEQYILKPTMREEIIIVRLDTNLKEDSILQQTDPTNPHQISMTGTMDKMVQVIEMGETIVVII